MAIPTPIIRNLDESGILRTMAIDLSDSVEDRAAIIEVLRSKLYSDKILAPIREYATNAADSHVEAGCAEIPINVVLPTPIMPEFRIRDFGIGLTPDEVEKIYIKYGRSTKRNTNSQTGQLGLGCKSAFAYGDNFNVVSYKDGVKTTYNLSISGVCSAILAEPMSADDKNGIEVIVPVAQDDVREFCDKAINFFKYWKVCPNLAGGDVYKLEELRKELANKPLFSDENWEVRPRHSYSNHSYSYGSEQGVAVMGNVPYPINWDIVSNKLNLRNDEKQGILYDFIRSNKTILRFNIGELDFSASRESLEYTEKTCKAVVARVETILDSIFKILNDKIQSAPTYWSALLIYNQIFGRDEDKLFQGDIFRLEKYYKGKFNYNGITIESGAFEHLENWDVEFGYSENGKWSCGGGTHGTGCNPILTTYHIHRNRMKQNRPNEYSNNRIPASEKIKIVIHDLEKPVLMKATVRWIFHSDSVNSPSKVYLLRFKDSAQQKEFFKKMNFDSAPVTYVSDVIDKVKAWLKASRSSVGGGSTGVRDPQQVRYFMPADRYNRGYIESIDWGREEVDLKETEGFYVALQNGNAVVNGEERCSLGMLSHHIHTLLNALGEPSVYVYGIPDRNRNAKWFEKAVEDDQWIAIDKYLKDKEDVILYGKGALAAKAAKFFKSLKGRSIEIGINFAEKILPLLKNKKGAMYLACKEISKDFFTMADLLAAFDYFKMSESLVNNCSVDFERLFKSVEFAYPMLSHIENRNYLSENNKRGSSINDAWLKAVADYVNVIDGAEKE